MLFTSEGPFREHMFLLFIFRWRLGKIFWINWFFSYWINRFFGFGIIMNHRGNPSIRISRKQFKQFLRSNAFGHLISLIYKHIDTLTLLQHVNNILRLYFLMLFQLSLKACQLLIK